MSYSELLDLWKDHPDIKSGMIKSWDDWQALFGEALIEGCSGDELQPEIRAAKIHFGIE